MKFQFIIVAALVSCFIADDSAAQRRGRPVPDEAELPLEQLQLFAEIFETIKENYVTPVSDRDLLDSAIQGMMEGLDPHSDYLNQFAYASLQEGTTGEFGGLGIEVSLQNGLIRVIAPIDDTPAYNAGIMAGDLISRIDDSPVDGMSLNDSIEMMRGEPGSDVTLTIWREGEDTPRIIVVTRDVIRVQSVRSEILEPGLGYMRISNFQERTGDDVRNALIDLQIETDNDLQGLILDLRNNPGGVLGASVEVSNVFLEQGQIVYTEGRVNDSEYEYRAYPPDMLNGTPLIVLVNEGSASASEIVAGALQDQKRALIVGRRTFGKGSVQSILPMDNEVAIKLTTARYYTPSGRSIQAQGIEPDVVISRLELVNAEIEGAGALSEADLANHLEGDESGDTPDNAGASDSGQGLAETDYELYEALNLLKGMVLVHARAEVTQSGPP